MLRLLRHIREDIRSVQERDPAARSAISVFLLYPGLHAIWAHRISHWLSLPWASQRAWHYLLAASSRVITGKS